MSSPRTFSWISTNTSMSAKRRTTALVKGSFRCLADGLGQRAVGIAREQLHARAFRFTSVISAAPFDGLMTGF